MPIVSCVVTIEPGKEKEVEKKMMEIPGVEVYGGELKEDAYYSIIVMDGKRYADLELMERQIKAIDGVLHVAVVEAHFLEEFEEIEKGEIVPENPFHGIKKAEKIAEKMWTGEDEDGKEGKEN